MMSAPALPLLLVEDDLDLAGNIQDYLEGRGWKVDYAMNGALALHRLLEQRHSAAVLDLNVPGMNGLELCQRLRQGIAPVLPVLMLTAADTLTDRLRGFEAGADDYLAKPFALAELLARLQALIRRSNPGTGAAPEAVLRVDDLELDPALRIVRRQGEVLRLTNMGFMLLEILLRQSPRVVPRAEIEAKLWGDNPPGSDALRTHLAALRAEVDRPTWKPLLHTHRGFGYQLVG